MNLEYVNTEWFNPDALVLPAYKVGRVTLGEEDGRSYVKLTEDYELEEDFRLFTSLTTAINCSRGGMPPQLLEWYCKHGLKEAKRLLRLSQHYGTLMHIMFGEFLRNGEMALNDINSMVDSYLQDKNFYQPECDDWPADLQKDLLAFAQFCFDCNVKPLAIELMLVSDRGYGTPIDLVCKMNIEVWGFFGETYKTDCKGGRKGDPKESKAEKTIIAGINFKSGKHAFYRENGLQCIMEKQLFEENFPDIKIDAAYNWAPKEWKSTPSYNLKDWADESFTQEEIDAVIKLAQIRFGEKANSKSYMNIDGVVLLGASLEENISFDTIEQFCKKRFTTNPVK